MNHVLSVPLPLVNEKLNSRASLFVAHGVLSTVSGDDVHQSISWVGSLREGEAHAFEVAVHAFGCSAVDAATRCEQKELIEFVENLFTRLVDDSDDSHAKLAHGFEQTHDRGRARGIQSRCRFVQEYRHGRCCQLDSNVHALSLAT